MTSLIHNIGGVITYDLKAEDVITSNIDSILIKNNYIDKINCSSNINSDTMIDAKGCLLTPGFIDSHTHPIFVNNRANEFNSHGLIYSNPPLLEICNTEWRHSSTNKWIALKNKASL